ncbi:unnamed protein product [Mycena citricolor]|uniref:UTP--glucose-1-phosphate uridylyltransferase n=1 Tax=Mycena citricolor TaxID=2018698 RepID=A0AAD2HSZ7_9AGAR|nr:unnamed protein product [Mycena citricolor]
MPLFKYRRFPLRKARKSQSNAASTSLQDELKCLVESVSDPADKKAFELEMRSFSDLFSRFLAEKSEGKQLQWDEVQPATVEQIIPYTDLEAPTDPQPLGKLAVLKVNGGLGTTMGMNGAKSALEVKGGMTFLDLTVKQIEHLNATYNADVPLILMTSFATHDDTLRIVRKYSQHKLRITTFNQSRYPRLLKDSFLPCAKTAVDDKATWYPPGHGDLYIALKQSGILDKLIADGIEYLFVSNSDNLGAVVDQRIFKQMIDSKAEFLMEVTEKTKADIKGGTLVSYRDSIRLLELAQVPPQYVDDFQSVRKFQIFNTNNLWINLHALKRVMDGGGMHLDVIANSKINERGEAVLQLETAAGAAIQHFQNAYGIRVPRSRFLPVKNCSDLLLIKSNMYSIEHGQLVPNPDRQFSATPVIKLGDHCKKIQQFHRRFKRIPDMLDLDHLTVSGDVYFGRDTTLRGTVIVVAHEGQRIDIPDGCILENRLLSGNLTMVASPFHSRCFYDSR